MCPTRMENVMPLRCPRDSSLPGKSSRGAGSRATATLAAAAIAILGGGALFGVSPVRAATISGVLVDEQFSGSSISSNWVAPTAPTGDNAACLTASGDVSGTPIPGCAGTADPEGSGALRLTDTNYYEEGGVAYALSVPTTYGLDARFDTYQYGGQPNADGIGFFLAASDPSNPQPPAAIGEPGGALGYSTYNGNPGMSDGYLGFGIDVFGLYTSPVFGGGDCTTPSWDPGYMPQEISVRGPGNDTTGYCVLASTVNQGGAGTIEGGTDGTRASSVVPVEIVINPGPTSVTSASGLTAAPYSFALAWTPIGGTLTTLSCGTPNNCALPDASSILPAGWYDSRGIPYQLTFGWVGSTGAYNDYHEVNDVEVTTLTGLAPDLTALVTDSAAGTPAHGSDLTYTIPVADASGSGREKAGITATDTLPAGVTSLQTGSGWSGGGAWTCSTSGQIVTCGDPAGLLPGGSPATLTIPVTVAAPAGSALTDAVTVSSDDANPASADDGATVIKAATSLVASSFPAATAQGGTVELSATGLPADATGTVGFSAAGSSLCSATVAAGAASCSAGAVPVGAYAVSAHYSGDTNYLASSASTGFSVTTSPALQLETAGTPSRAAAGSSYTLRLTASLSSADGPAYGDPQLTATLPAGETFTAAPTGGPWSCSLASGGTVLSCTSTAATPIAAGTALATVTAGVDIAAAASGTLTTAVSLTDSADGALAVSTDAAVTVSASVTVPDTGAGSGRGPAIPLGALLVAMGIVVLGRPPRRDRHPSPATDLD